MNEILNLMQKLQQVQFETLQLHLESIQKELEIIKQNLIQNKNEKTNIH